MQYGVHDRLTIIVTASPAVTNPSDHFRHRFACMLPGNPDMAAVVGILLIHESRTYGVNHESLPCAWIKNFR